MVHRLPSVLPVERRDHQRLVALVISPTERRDALTLIVNFAEKFRREGWIPHLVVLGTGALAWTQEEGAAFESIISFPLPFLPLAPSAKVTAAYLGTVVPLLTDADAEYALGTLAPFDRIVVFDHPAAYTLTGRIRRLGVEIWIVLGQQAGISEGRLSPFDSIAACAAFENACDVIVPLDANTETLCRALGLPEAKFSRLDDNPRLT